MGPPLEANRVKVYWTIPGTGDVEEVDLEEYLGRVYAMADQARRDVEAVRRKVYRVEENERAATEPQTVADLVGSNGAVQQPGDYSGYRLGQRVVR